MSYKETFDRTVDGVTFEVFIEESDGYRRIAIHDKEQRETEHHSYVITRDERSRYEPGLIARLRGEKQKPIPDRESHIADAFNKAMSKYFDREKEENEMREQIELVLDAGSEAWNEET